jgi:RNA polymerase sigma-70 factor, ECF subfamily
VRRLVVAPALSALLGACFQELSEKGRLVVALRHACGLSAERVARLLLTTEAELARDAHAPAAKEKLTTVLTVIYLLYTDAFARMRRGTVDPIRLGRALFALFPSHPAVAGLLALMTLHDARARARFDVDGRVIPLDRQDRAAWDVDGIERGAALLLHAIRLGPLDARGIEAAIALEHASPGPKRWDRIEALYADLEALSPSPVIALNRAVAIAHVHGPAAALERIAPLADALDGYVPYAVLTAMLFRDLGRLDDARRAFDRAIAWSRDETEIAHLREERRKT